MKDIFEDPLFLPFIKFSKSIIKYYAKSFYFASAFLPKRKKLATYVIYSFCRYVDNIIDKPRLRSKEELNNELDSIKTELSIANKYGESEHPIIGIFIKVIKQYGIPIEYAFDLIEGVRMDLNYDRYENFDDLYKFCYRVASVVGLMMTFILGFKNQKTLIYAEKLGIAMQLTNILRDIKEDKVNGKIYLPMDEMRAYNITEEDIINENFNEKFKNFIIFQSNRAKTFYEESKDGIPLLDKDSRFAIYAALKIYSGILQEIEKLDYNVFKQRAYVSTSKKISILVSEYFRNILKK